MSQSPPGARDAADQSAGEPPTASGAEALNEEVETLIGLLTQLNDQTKALVEALTKTGENPDRPVEPTPQERTSTGDQPSRD